VEDPARAAGDGEAQATSSEESSPSGEGHDTSTDGHAPSDHDDTGSSQDAGVADASVTLDDRPTMSGAAVWTDASRSLEVHWLSFFEGGYRFVRQREQLSDEQLALLDEMREIRGIGACLQDAASVVVSVADQGGAVREYKGTGGGCEGDTVSTASVTALLRTVSCISAKQDVVPTMEPGTSPEIAVDDGCQHGVFNGYGTTPHWWFRVVVEEASELRVRTIRCGNRELILTLHGTDGATELASTRRAGEPCPSIVHDFEEPGTYPTGPAPFAGLVQFR
jgi:hypothetical protein